MVRGTVKTWDHDAGHGVLTSEDLPADVLAEARAMRGRRAALAPGDHVLFDYEPLFEPRASDHAPDVGFRAVWVRARPAFG